MVLEFWNVSPTDNRAVHCTLVNTLSLSENYSQTVANAGWHQGRDVLVCTLTSHNSVLLGYFPVVVQPLSRVQFFATPWIAGPQAPLSFTVSQSLLKFTTVESVMPSNHLILFRLLLLLPLIFPRFTFL